MGIEHLFPGFIFVLGSISVPFTGVSVMQLARPSYISIANVNFHDDSGHNKNRLKDTFVTTMVNLYKYSSDTLKQYG